MRPDPLLERIRSNSDWCRRDVLEATLDLAIEIAREGREGRRVGALFTLGHADAVLACSRALILDPLAGHAPRATHITDPHLRGTLKELAQLMAPSSWLTTGRLSRPAGISTSRLKGRETLGLGRRHLAGAAISKQLGVVAIGLSAFEPFHDHDSPIDHGRSSPGCSPASKSSRLSRRGRPNIWSAIRARDSLTAWRSPENNIHPASGATT
jgi:hypothetical protein